MTTKLYIDGVDAYRAYGAYLAEGSLGALVALPAFKDVAVSEWAEEDGEEADLSNPVLPSRSVNLTLYVADKEKIALLFDILGDGAYHLFYFAFVSRTFKLRLVQVPSFSSVRSLGAITLRFQDDFPPVVPPAGLSGSDLSAWKVQFDPTTVFLEQIPSSASPNNYQGFEIDGVDVSHFGARLLKGTEDNILRAPDPKEALSRSSKYLPGSTYDNGRGYVVYKSKDASLNLLITTATAIGFWQRWEALFTALLAPGQRHIYYDNTGEENLAYYKGSKVLSFLCGANGSIWCEMQVTLRYTNARPFEGGYILSTQDGTPITTQANELIEI